MANHYFDPSRVVSFSDAKMAKINLHESPRMFCDVYCLQPGQAQKDHAHESSDKLYLCLTGTPTVRIGEQSRSLPPGELAVAPAGLVHGVRNDSSEPATLLVVMAPPPGR